MKNSSPTHLYRYQDSQNYFIRFRMNFFKNIDYIKPDAYFVASLRTSSYDDAKWLAFYIKRQLMKEMSMDSFSHNTVKFAMPLGEKFNSRAPLLHHETASSNAQFKTLLREKFAALLKVGKLMLENGFGQNAELQTSLSDEQMLALGSESEQFASVSEQSAMLKMISTNSVDLTIDPKRKYLDYREMINAFTKQLGELQTQLTVMV